MSVCLCFPQYGVMNKTFFVVTYTVTDFKCYVKVRTFHLVFYILSKTTSADGHTVPNAGT